MPEVGRRDPELEPDAIRAGMPAARESMIIAVLNCTQKPRLVRRNRASESEDREPSAASSTRSRE